MKFENTAVFNFEGAIRSMRNPLNSWNKSDSHYCLPNECINCKYGGCQEPKKDVYHWDPCTGDDIDWTPYLIGENDLNLAQRLLAGGSEHSKFMRAIGINVDIIAPQFWVAEHDTYKVGTTRNSCSFMHKGVSKPFELSDFEQHTDKFLLEFEVTDAWHNVICALNKLRDLYLETKDEKYFLAIRSLLPMGYNYRYIWTANYAILRNIYFQRRNHRLPEWHEFCDWIASLPYGKELIMYEK